jgi:hypothetical protein
MLPVPPIGPYVPASGYVVTKQHVDRGDGAAVSSPSIVILLTLCGSRKQPVGSKAPPLSDAVNVRVHDPGSGAHSPAAVWRGRSASTCGAAVTSVGASVSRHADTTDDKAAITKAATHRALINALIDWGIR